MKSLLTFGLSWFIMVSTSGQSMMDKEPHLMNLLPEGGTALSVESEQVIETHKDFYAYINGGAELYLNYGFKILAQRVYLFNGKEIKAEVYDMGEPVNAFGVFSYSTDTVNSPIGQGGQYLSGSLVFWKDRYFVSIFTHRETPELKDTMRELGNNIAGKIGKKGELPPIFSVIPQRSLVKGSTFYFHHPAWQNKYRYISNNNIFNINEKVHAVLNQYGTPHNRHYLLLIEYPADRKARRAYNKGAAALSAELKRNGLSQDEDNRWMGADIIGKLLIIVLDAPSKEKALYLLEETGENYTRLKK